MIKSILFQIVLLVVIVIQQIIALNLVDIPNHRAKGIQKVPTGAISHCQIDQGQQCFNVYPSIDDISLTNPNNLTISCDPSNLCVFGFEPSIDLPLVTITINCLDTQGFEEDSNITASFGNFCKGKECENYHGQFIVQGENAYAKWDQTDVSYFDQSSGPINTTKRAEVLDIKCHPVNPFKQC